MILKDISLPKPQENILFDEVLLSLAEQGERDEVLRFWVSQELFIVLGRIGKAEEDLKINEVKKDGIPVLRRCSGGGTVLQGKGCLNYSLILSKERHREILDLRKSYQFILNQVIRALKPFGIEAVYQPVSDIALVEDHKKISGNAQKRSRKYILHHGTILYDFDLSQMEKYLKIPKEVPAYRHQRPHLEFVTNVSLTEREIKNGFKQIFHCEEQSDTLTEDERNCLMTFLKTKNVIVSPVAN